MRSFYRTLSFVMLILAVSLAVSCTRGGNPVDPSGNSDQLSQISNLSSEQSRSVIGMYSATIDSESGSFAIEPVERVGSYHVPLSMFPGVVSVTYFNFGPPFVADIRLKHPYPGSGVDFFDPRIIAVLPARTGVSMSYPSMDILANHSVLLSPDGYTKLWDVESLTGNANPFVAYFKDFPNRKMSSTGATQETKRWMMNLSGFGGDLNFYLVVDACTNYPNPSLEGVHNAPEPVQLTCEISDLNSDIGYTDVEAVVLDWQGSGTIGGVSVEAPGIFNGVKNLSFSHTGPGADRYTYSGTIYNDLNAPAGDYKILAKASDAGTGIAMYSEFDLKVIESHIPDNPTDKTSYALNLAPYDIFIKDNYAFIASSLNGLYIMNVEDPYNPYWVKSVDTPDRALGVQVVGEYAFVADSAFGLQIIDIDPPESAYIVKSVDTSGITIGIHIEGDYAYLADASMGLRIVDINPISLSSIVKTVDTPGYAEEVDIQGNYAFVADGESGLQVIDISNINSASIIKNVDTTYAKDVKVNGEYVYVADADAGLRVIHINPVDSASIVKTIDTPDSSQGLYLFGNHIFAADAYSCLQVINIDNPVNAYIEKSAGTYAIGKVFVTSEYAYGAGGDFHGLEIIDINPLNTAFTVYKHPALSKANGVYGSGDYLYVMDFYNQLHVLNAGMPESPYLVKHVTFSAYPEDVFVKGNYAYVGDAWGDLRIVNISIPENASITGTANGNGSVVDVHVEGNYAYLASKATGLQIADVTNPNAPVIIKTVATSDEANSVYVTGGYAYVACRNAGVQIIDVDPVSSAYIVNTIDTPGSANGIYVSGGYIYVADGSSGLQIITDHIVKSVDTPGTANRVQVQGGYAYVADGPSGLQVVDVTTPETGHIIASRDTPDNAVDLYVSGSYVYISDVDGGIRIFDLW
jgi:hypothetical protein